MEIKNTSTQPARLLRLAVLAFSLLVGLAGSALAQTPPSVIYTLGGVTQTYTVTAGNQTFTYPAGSQVIGQVNPANLSNSSNLFVPGSLLVINGITAGQQLVGIDTRPSTGKLYALGYNSTTQEAQLYTLDPSTGIATSVAAAFTGLDLQDTNSSNTRGLVPNIGFDFNPRVDRIRVVAPNRTDYRLNPNTGGLAVTDGTLTYVSGTRVPYIGTVGYTNSALGIAGTTLYDVDVANTNGLLSIQNQPNNGTLNPVAAVTFQTNNAPTSVPFSPLASPTIGLGLDIYYDRTSSTNIAYLIEARYSDPTNTDINNQANNPQTTPRNQFSSNLFVLNLTNGQAVGKNIFGQIPIYLNDIAAAINAPKTWVGTTDTNWGVATNWLPVGAPTSTDDVFIPATGTVVFNGTVVARQPTVSDAQQANSVTTSAGAIVTLSSASTLTVTNDYTNNDGTLQTTATSGTLTVGSDFANNSGTVQSNVAGGTLDIFSTTFTSSGMVAVANGGILSIRNNFTNTGTVNTATGSTLNLYANFVNNGTVVGTGTGTVALIGAASQQISSTVTPAITTNFQNLSVGTAGATTSSAVSITRSLTVTGTLTIGTNIAFTLLSNVSATAFVVNNGSGTVTGTATVQRYIDPSINSGMGYRHYSAPVTNTTVNDLATTGFAPIFNTAYNISTAPGTTNPFPTVYGYNQTQFENSPATVITTLFDKGFYSPASGDPMVTGNGYAVEINGNQLVDFVGTLANGNYSTPLQGRSAKTDAGWQLLGNPYPSVIDWNAVVASGLVNLRNAVYVVKSTGAYSGIYGSYVNGVATNGGSRFIPVAQGFFVQASAVGVSGNINFMNTQRVITDDTAPFQRSTPDVRPQLLLELTDGTKAIQTDIYFESGATTGLDNAYDAVAMPFIGNLVLASAANNDILAINGLPALTGTVTVPLRLAAATAGTYTVHVANLANLPAGYHAFLHDAAQNTTTDLTSTPNVSVSLPAGAAVAGRFTVTFTTANALATTSATATLALTVYPNPTAGTATLSYYLPTSTKVSAQVFDALGRNVLVITANEPQAAGAHTLSVPALPAGVYTVRLQHEGAADHRQLVVE
ncbi:MAG: DUF4394 domain-containing protein [Janthinobacterium lividum]